MRGRRGVPAVEKNERNVMAYGQGLASCGRVSLRALDDGGGLWAGRELTDVHIDDLKEAYQ